MKKEYLKKEVLQLCKSFYDLGRIKGALDITEANTEIPKDHAAIFIKELGEKLESSMWQKLEDLFADKEADPIE